MIVSAFVPNRTQLAIMQLIHGYFCKTRREWAIIDQRWMLRKLKEWHGLEVSRSCLAKNLRFLREKGLFESQRRHWNRPVSKVGQGSPQPGNGKFEPRPSLYKFTKALKAFFHSVAAYFKRCEWVPVLPGFAPPVGKHAAAAQARHRAERIEEINEEARRGSAPPLPDGVSAREALFAKYGKGGKA